MGWGATQDVKTTQQGNTNQQGLNANLPVQLPWVAQMQQQNAIQAQNQYAQAQQPVYGDAQKAQFLQNQNQQEQQGQKALASQLASHGIQDSGATAAGLTSLEGGRQANIANYEAQVPLANRQARQAQESQALGLEMGAAAAPPTGNISTSSSTGSTSQQGDQTTTQTPGLAGLLTTLGGAAISGLTGGMGGGAGLGGLMGGSGGKGGAGAPQQMAFGNALPFGSGAPYPPTPPGFGSTPGSILNNEFGDFR